MDSFLIIPIFQIMRLRYIEVKLLPRGHRVGGRAGIGTLKVWFRSQ